MPTSRRQDLIDAAIRLFRAQGVHATGIDAILKEASVSRMTLYNHFKSKDDLVLAALEVQHDRLSLALDEALAQAPSDPVDRLLALVEFRATWITTPDFHGCLFVNAAAEFPETDCAIRKCIAQHKRNFVTRLADEARAAALTHPEALAERVSLVLEGAAAAVLATTNRCSTVPDALTAQDAADHARATCEILIERAFENATA